jgi:CcmD family protein
VRCDVRRATCYVRRATCCVPRILLAVILLVVLTGVGTSSFAAQPPTRPADEGFVPIDQLPPDEKLPAAPLPIAAYSVAWVVVAFYLWSIWQRLARVERELADVSRRLGQGGRGGGPQ